MSGGESKPRELSTEEISAALDWIDGELDSQAASDFEFRLSQDGELARQVEELSHLDTFMRREARARIVHAAPRRSWRTWVALAAALVAVVALVVQLFESKSVECQVALAPSFALAEDWINQQPGLEGASAPGIGVSRGSNSKPMSAADFLRASETIEASVASSAIAQNRREIEAGWFVVPIELGVRSAVLVLDFPREGRAERLFPARDEHDGDQCMLEQGRHMLPSARAVVGATPDTLEYRPGFLVPLGAKELTLLVAVRKGTAVSSLLSQIDGQLAAGASADQVSKHLIESGFAVQRLTVREPK